jgi:glycosyltransferase involved in cell wall biosynthesis
MDILPFRLLNLITITVSIAWHAFLSLRPDDLVIAVTNPPSLPFVGVLAASCRRARSIVLVHDLYPDALVAARLLHGRSPAVRWLERMHRWLYASADAIVVLGRDMREQVVRRCPFPDRVSVITHWAEVDDVVRLDRLTNPLLRKLGLEQRFVIQYSGNMGRTHDLPTLLEAARLLAGDEEIHFLLIGGGAGRLAVEQFLRDNPLRNVTLLGGYPRSELRISLNACDISVVVLYPGMAGISVPSRLYNVLATGKPIIAATEEDSELGRVIREEDVGWVVPPGDPEALVRAIRQARDSRDGFRALGDRARSAAVEKYSQEKVIESFDRLVRSMAGQRRDCSCTHSSSASA